MTDAMADDLMAGLKAKGNNVAATTYVLYRRPSMVSVDHFAYELRSQLRTAAVQGATSIVIASGELCQSVRMGSASMDACCEAMQQEVRSGDTVLRGKEVGVGMTVRYQLPRS
ncbi:hypothetical protein [Bradyrhizobium sp. OAE829]|uniref:hypothetical protein n=1 Tax=Bradyrhizobium sp. OAE829 TaxID=2663807 RepID=UPI00178B0FCA